MGEAKRRKRTAYEEILDLALHKSGDINVVVTPIVHRPDEGGEREYYFTIATCDEKKEFRCDKIELKIDTEEKREAMRSSVIMEFLHRKPILVHDTDDELYAAWLCETLWPGERISGVRKGIEQERAQWAAEASRGIQK
jgi:hypothetical protein